MPFAEYLDSNEDTPSGVDMIIGGDLVWKYVLCSVGLNENGCKFSNSVKLGPVWLSSSKGSESQQLLTADQLRSNDDTTTANCCTVRQSMQQSSGSCDKVLKTENMSHTFNSLSKIRLSPDDRKEDMVFIEHDPFYCSPSDEKLAMSITDEEVLKFYRDTVEKVVLENGETHLQFKLPWAKDPKSMPNNYFQAKTALMKLQSKLKDQPEIRDKYCEKIDAAINQGHIVRIADDDLQQDLNDDSKLQYYIPHFNTAQSKFRVVYDAAREYRGVSLNKLLSRGPIFMQSLRSILIRFGEKKYGLAGDIANMFFQIRIDPADRDMLRILWFSQPEMKGELVAYQFQVAPYGLRCIPSIAGYSMIFTAEENVPHASDDAVCRVTRDMFVDDFITAVNSVAEGRRVASEVTELLSSTGFKITKWSASDKAILNDRPTDDCAPGLRDIRAKEHDGTPIQRQHTLGLAWNTDTDELTMKKPKFLLEKQEALTKRKVMSYNHQVFDPLSWWAPCYVKMNLCCSKIVRSITDWDTQVPSELAKEWHQAIRYLPDVEDLPLPRRRVPFDTTRGSKFEYHVFTDSSKDVAAAAVYLRVQTGEKCAVNLIAAKTSIFSQAEMARGSIPRKELIALDLGARLLKECLSSTSLKIDNFELWSDSRTVIQWCSEKSLELRVFERNRVNNILRISQGKIPRYVPTDKNPADVATRPFDFNKHSDRWDLWTKGPQFLLHPNLTSDETAENSTCKLNSCQPKETIVTDKAKSTNSGFMQHTLDRTNQLTKVMTIATNVVKCFQKWKTRLKDRNQSMTPMTDTELQQAAKLTLIRAAQREFFGSIIDVMQSGSTFEDATKADMKHNKDLNSMKKFVPYLDADNILRVGGRLQYCGDLTEEAKHPAFLPPEHKITKLFVLNQHAKLAHRASDWILSSLISDVGVIPINGARTVRSMIKDCFVCKLLQTTRSEQLMAPLPEFRVKPREAVFHSISIDYAGPYEVKRGRSLEKRWVCLFVCNVTTAVRIELVESLEATAFLNCFRRFLCLTGNKTCHIRSDGATTFVGAKNILDRDLAKTKTKATNSMEVQNFSREAGVIWDFSTPTASHHQGTVERQIRTFKEVSDGILGAKNNKRPPSDFEFMTLLREAEYIMNTRPLGKCVSTLDNIQPLRPIDLMTGFMDPSDQGYSMRDATNSKDKFRRGIQYTRRLADEWWQEWMNRCLHPLQSRQKWRREQRNFQPGDLVLLDDPTTPPIGRYPYAIVIDVKQCNDGLVRSVTVRMADGRTRERDVHKLVLLEPKDTNSEELCVLQPKSKSQLFGSTIEHDNMNALSNCDDITNCGQVMHIGGTVHVRGDDKLHIGDTVHVYTNCS